MSESTSEVVESIDAVLHDWEVSDDAMRWVPDASPDELAELDPSLSSPIYHGAGNQYWFTLEQLVGRGAPAGPPVELRVEDGWQDVGYTTEPVIDGFRMATHNAATALEVMAEQVMLFGNVMVEVVRDAHLPPGVFILGSHMRPLPLPAFDWSLLTGRPNVWDADSIRGSVARAVVTGGDPAIRAALDTLERRCDDPRAPGFRAPRPVTPVPPSGPTGIVRRTRAETLLNGPSHNPHRHRGIS